MLEAKEFRILKSEPILFLTIPISMMIMLLLILIRPFLVVRFGLLHSDRIGHFLINTELFLCEEIAFKKKKNFFDLFYFPTTPCNLQVAKMLKRKIHILPKVIVRPFCLISRKYKFLSIHVTGKSIAGDYDVKNVLDKFKPQIKFTKDEIIYGLNQLIKMGIKDNNKIICLAVRDDSYLKKEFPNSNFSYHSHRNENISKYLPAIKYLIKKGYFVIRMGSITKKPINFSHENFLDYSKSKFKSDFMDMFISSKCKLFISNNTGVDAFGILFRKPLLHIGSIPLGAISTFSTKIFNTILNHYSLKLRRNLTLSEIFTQNLSLGWTSNFYKKNQILLIKFTSQEILIYIKEVLEILKNNKIKKKKNLEDKFKDNYLLNLKKFPEAKIYHGKIKSHFLLSFLKKNKNFLN
tara:strand:- start:276 stop:1496 length:1221 start_codon:yes stop_codon:yes gene_type:complete